MKKFVLLTIGFTDPTPDIMADWQKWFDQYGDKIVEKNGLMNGVEVTKSQTNDLPMDHQAITGYMVVEGDDIEDALEIAKACPMITSTKVYEVRSY